MMHKYVPHPYLVSIGLSVCAALGLIWLAHSFTPHVTHASSCTVICTCNGAGTAQCTGADDGEGGCTGSYEVSMSSCTTTLSCAPAYQEVDTFEQATITADGGNGQYVWQAPGGTPYRETGTSTTFNVEYGVSGDKTVTLSSGGVDSVQCVVAVSGDGEAEEEESESEFTYDGSIGLDIPPSGGSVESAAPFTIDVLHSGTINSGCDGVTNICYMSYFIDCENDGFSEEIDLFVYPVYDGVYSYIHRDVCSYSDAGEYTVRTDGWLNNQRLEEGGYVTETVKKTDYMTVNPAEEESGDDDVTATCSPSSQEKEIGETAAFTGSATGTNVSCAWSAPGGTPSTGSSCTSFSTVYDSIGGKTVSFAVTADEGDVSDDCIVDVVEELSVTHSVTITRNGQGAITSSPAGISCGGTCTAEFEEDAVVTLTADPIDGWSFIEWSGDCIGTSVSCPISVDGNKEVTAKFRPDAVFEGF